MTDDKKPREFFESEWFKDATSKLCADGWPLFVVPLNVKINELLESHDSLAESLKAAEAEIETYKIKEKNLIENWGEANAEIERLKVHAEKLALVIPLLKASSDSPEAICAVMIPAAEQLRRAAAEMENKDKLIFQARQALAEYRKEFKK